MGTRPEIIKMAPVIRRLERQEDIESIVISTCQQREMSNQFFEEFGIRKDIDLDVMIPSQSLAHITAKVSERLDKVLADLKPDVVLIQGDTSTACIGGLIAFYHRIAVGHVEAGLRTNDIESPFPEELNRQIIGRYATFSFVPTLRARQNLEMENINPASIYHTGNTVVDSLLHLVANDPSFLDPETVKGSATRTILVTAHRRENLGAPMRDICDAINRITAHCPEVNVVFPVHPNPKVREVVYGSLESNSSVRLIEPVEYRELMRIMSGAYLILTDSGGLQEEAPTMHKPVLVLRKETERPEVIEAGGAVLVGTDSDMIFDTTVSLLKDDSRYAAMSNVPNPFGDGRAANRIVDVLRGHLGLTVPEPTPALKAGQTSDEVD